MRFIKLATAALLTLPAAAHAETDRWMTPTMLKARGDFMNPNLNYLTFQHLDQMFATREVKAGSKASALAVDLKPIGGTFDFEGKSLPLDDYLESTSTNALLIIHGGKIVHQSYRNGSNEHTRFMSFSMAKSILATMVGIAESEGKIKSLDDKVVDYLPDWAGSAYANVMIKDLLRMRSGIDWKEVYEFGSQTQLTEVHDNALVAYKYRWCDYAKDKSKKLHDPGTTFNYSTLDTSVLGCVLEKAVGMKGADYLSQKIWSKAGMEADGYYILDGSDNVGREFFGAGFNATLRDYGRFGLMMLNEGKSNGQQVVPAEWVKRSTIPENGSEPAGEGEDLGYAYQWWTIPNSDAYSAIGLFNQYTFVDPKSKTVIVKLDAPASPLGWDKENIAFFQKIADQLSKK